MQQPRGAADSSYAVTPPRRSKQETAAELAGYEGLFADVTRAIEEARRAAARSVNAVMTATYWLVGRRIVEQEQGGEARASYGEAILERLSAVSDR